MAPRCATPHCRGCTTPGGRSPVCGKCRYRRWRDRNPLACAFNNLRKRARQRGHKFELSFEEYKEFAIRTGYLTSRGKTSTSMSIDRIRESEGYHKDNIRILTLSENTRRRYVPFFAEQEAPPPDNNEPF